MGSPLKLCSFIVSLSQGFAQDFSDAELNVGVHISTTAAAARTCCATFRAALLILFSQGKLHGVISGLFPSIIHYSLPSSIILFWCYLCYHFMENFLLQVCSLSSAPYPYRKKAASHRIQQTRNFNIRKTTDFDAFLPLLIYSPLRSLLSNAVETKPQNAKELKLF